MATYLTHVDCGGNVFADWSKLTAGGLPTHRCYKCGEEIVREEDVDLGNDQQRRRYRVKYSNGRREWLSIVYRERGNVIHVLTVGCEDSLSAAEEWAQGTVQMMEEGACDDVELPDKYTRQLNRHFGG